MPDIVSLYKVYRDYPSVQTDTRKLQTGDIYFALKGPNFNGNAFAEKALSQGAAYAVIDEEKYKTDARMILTEDVLTTLQQLAHHHRQQLNIPFLSVTGSNGKTTTKELVRTVLSTAYSTYATEGNLNNHIGIPLTLLRIKSDVEIAVIEMGANHQKEIEGYCKIVNPTHGIITNVGKAHLEGFGGIEGVKKGKGELFDYLRTYGGTAFVCRDFDYFHEMTHDIHEVVWYGTSDNGYVHGKVDAHDPFLSMETNYTGILNTQMVGSYNQYNVLAAVTIGKYFNINAASVKKAIEAYIPSNSRSQFIQRHNNAFILDAYNANPTSMQAAIENFADSKNYDKKVLMLGGMMELGIESLEEHQKLVDLIGKYPWHEVVLVGGDFSKIKHPYLYLPDSNAAKAWFESRNFHDMTILVKGSRAIAMEKVIQ